MTTVRDRVAMPQKGTVSSRTVVLIGLGWLVLATGVGAFGLVSTLRPPALPRGLHTVERVRIGGHPVRGGDGGSPGGGGSGVNGGAAAIATEPAADVPRAVDHREPRDPGGAACSLKRCARGLSSGVGWLTGR